ncbi:hypothetical protein [Tessaracoccus antarcticus]|uniref:DUF3466 family protein n=1 Tax=Tessaracoccus antarcticus TaxID=2479848 RepID=A0A3M0GH10_9ACTN|nr:hypothetical protein [Tessaracoccus antarcticus]RMB62012.1 hypothetical protein EAX62_05345 [Tessaracoccus antarcticus]
MRTLLAVGSAAALIAGLGIATTPTANAAPPPSYTIELLPPVAGYWGVEPTGLNDAGDVVGLLRANGTNNDASALWRSGARAHPVRIAPTSTAYGISGTGVVPVIAESAPGAGGWKALLWRNGTSSVVATGAGSQGGWSTISENSIALTSGGALWTSPTAATQLSRTVGSRTYAELETADISSNGRFVVGKARDSGEYGDAVRWTDKAMKVLGTPYGTEDHDVAGVNDAGVAVGWGSPPSPLGFPNATPVIWDSKGTPSALPMRKSFGSVQALAINNSGTVVGSVDDLRHALVWQDGAVFDLNDVVRKPEGMTIETAIDINASGQIIGVASPAEGPEVGYIATPKAFDVYTTPGTHHYNGRDWRTTCEPYSRTTRCRTEIQATTIQVINGRYVHAKGWAFNNLTYLPSARTLWKSNPLAQPGNHTINGRQWKTECDNAHTGRNGCRSYMLVSVITATATTGGGYTYAVRDAWVFNNIVKFN